MSPSSPKTKGHVRQTTAQRQQNLQERVDAARREDKQKPVRVAPYIEYKNVDPGIETALYYGFTPHQAPLTITKEDREKAKSIGDEEKSRPFSIAPALEEKIALLRYYDEKNLHNGAQPLMFAIEFQNGGAAKKKQAERKLSLEIMGSFKSIGEATLIQTALATLQEEGHTDLCLSINSIGDRESMNRFMRELGNYYRKHLASLPQACKALLRKSPLDLLLCEHEKCKALAAEAPKSIGFLGDESRRHFKEVLEYLEELDIPYCIDPLLIGDRAFASETLFQIHEVKEGKEPRCLCSGARYNTLGKRLGFKREVPSIGANLLLPPLAKETSKTRQIRFKKPTIFFLQLGFCAKLKSLSVIELLRKARIALYQALNRDKLISQISSVENLRIPYSIILGQREALENSVIVRNTSTRAQETVPIHRLAEHVQKMKLG
ncbi:MAG: His/Gly/Thr/Pro-type tRNA ligase C-terminal domain-containing protein [bacterium]|nr:His/Gly/Thr/Pro-type tRNA ligase C-terminal domain-containing protein [bacterium]